ncbi:MAG: hypothetical protein CL846_05265 [Crocinitomicaceae bacterium]|nr:hypothetical protein [Crocinitomicaceae bacterium]
MNFKLNILFSLLGIILINSCDFKENESKKLARINDEFLYLDDIINEIPINIKGEDSIIYVKNYIQNWLTNKLIVKKSEELIPNNLIKVDKKIEKYRSSLISYEFEQFYVSRRLDTNITTYEILDYYNKHTDDFILNDYIIKCLYLKTSKNSPILKDLKKIYQLKNDNDIDNLTKLSQKNIELFYYNNEEWIFFDELLKQIPIEVNNKINFIKKEKIRYFEKGDFIYFVNIYDYRIKDGKSPLSLEKEKIKSILLNNRANELRKELKSNLYNDGIQNNIIEIFK